MRELPGMWEEADFMGGSTDDPAETDICLGSIRAQIATAERFGMVRLEVSAASLKRIEAELTRLADEVVQLREDKRELIDEISTLVWLADH